MSILRYENVEWALPYLFGFDIQLIKIAKLLHDFEIAFKFNAFGSVKSKWSGGRVSVVTTEDKDFIMRLFSHLVDIGVTPSLTFSRHDICKEDLKDPFCNYILDIAQALDCNLILSSDLLFDYIKNKYPDAICTASVIKPTFEFQTPQKLKNYNFEEELNYYNMLLKNYNKVVVRPEFAKIHLPNICEKINDISKIEVLINQICVPNCPIATSHYKHFEEVEKLKETTENLIFECYHKKHPKSLIENANDNLLFEIEEIDKLVELGIRYLKLQGRAGTQGDLMPFLAFYNYVLKPGGKTLSFQYAFDKPDPDLEAFFKREILRQV